MTAHTPGPWSLVRSVKNWQMPLQIEAQDGTCIVALEPHPLHDMEAIARLIAAAPELLDALTALLERANDELADPQDLWEITAAKEAIAKAKGEQP